MNNKIKQKKKGQVGIIYFVAFLFLILFIGIGIVFAGVTIDWTFDNITPEFTSLGMFGDVNASQVSSITISPINNFVQSFTWLSGIIYILLLFGMLGLAFAFRFTGNKWLMAFFFGCMFMLIIGSIFISNIYEDFYNDSGEVADRLHEYDMISYLILYSPAVMCLIGFIGGIIMFTGNNQEGEI